MDRDPEGQSGRYYMTSLQTVLQVCWHVLLEEKLFPTLINLQDMCVKDFNFIALACK